MFPVGLIEINKILELNKISNQENSNQERQRRMVDTSSNFKNITKLFPLIPKINHFHKKFKKGNISNTKLFGNNNLTKKAEYYSRWPTRAISRN